METNSLESLENCYSKECIDNLVTNKLLKTLMHSRFVPRTAARVQVDVLSLEVTRSLWQLQWHRQGTRHNSMSYFLFLPLSCLCLYCACTLDNVHCCITCYNLMLQYFFHRFVNMKGSRGCFCYTIGAIGFFFFLFLIETGLYFETFIDCSCFTVKVDTNLPSPTFVKHSVLCMTEAKIYCEFYVQNVCSFLLTPLADFVICNGVAGICLVTSPLFDLISATSLDVGCYFCPYCLEKCKLCKETNLLLLLPVLSGWSSIEPKTRDLCTQSGWSLSDGLLWSQTGNSV